eukprot:SAG31_NODE_33040_length_348_cov_1.433735_1_plen_55_part_01
MASSNVSKLYINKHNNGSSLDCGASSSDLPRRIVHVTSTLYLPILEYVRIIVDPK